MSLNTGLDRRAFLKSAGMTALASAVGTASSAEAAVAGATVQPQGSRFDFDMPWCTTRDLGQ